jgi:AcrR family transcriptional regulator
VAAAGELAYRRGVERTTLADIAEAAAVPVGNVYYYFKTKDDLIAAVVDARVAELTETFAALERKHDSPADRLKGLIADVAAQGEPTARSGCPYGSLCSELIKRGGGAPLSARVMRVLLDWPARQFRELGRDDADDLALELVTSYQGAAVVAGGLGEAEVMTRQAARLERWIDSLVTVSAADRAAKKGRRS